MMLNINQWFLLVFLCFCAWQDINTQTISVALYWFFGITALCLCFIGENPVDWLEKGSSMGIGIFLLVLSKFSKGAIGSGDGWFFVISGMFLSFWNNVTLLLYGLLFCSCYCLIIAVWGQIYHIRVGKRTVPFLPFLLPVGLWMVIM